MNQKNQQPRVNAKPLSIAGGIIILIFAAAIVYPDLREYFPSAKTNVNDRTENTLSQEPVSPDSENDPLPPESSREVVVEDLSVPWDMAFLPDGSFLITEREGNLVRVDGSRVTIDVPEVSETGEGGLLGIALDPSFEENQLIYLYTTDVLLDRVVNRVVRFTFDQETNTLSNRRVLIDSIPGAPYHDGGRLRFGPGDLLFITTGDAGTEDNAQSTSTLAGKILRIYKDGSVPNTNPFNTPVYSYGHRNPQGITWDENGNLWSTEHGRSGVRSGFDEVNLIESGKNYGWPVIQGPEAQDGMISPKAQSGPTTTWAPASALYWDGSIFFGGLRGAALYEAVLDGTEVRTVKEHFKNEYGRIRTVTQGPDGYFYIMTSNRDGRGTPTEGDDKVIRINPQIFR